jgi:hypothetical protein
MPLYAQVGDSLRPLNMIRTYWDPNADFANQQIECTNYRHIPLQDWRQGYESFTITHHPLPDVSPWMSEYEISFQIAEDNIVRSNVWRTANGIYFGDYYFYTPDHFTGFYAGRWGEPIEIDGQQGMRFWPTLGGETINGELYQECKHTSGLPFRPTGHPDSSPTPSGHTVSSFPSLPPGPPEDQKPEIINRETGETVQLKSFSWDIQEDLLYKTISCNDRDWNGHYYDSFYFEADDYLFMPPLPGQTTGNIYVNVRGHNIREKREWSFDNGHLIALSQFPLESG